MEILNKEQLKEKIDEFLQNNSYVKFLVKELKDQPEVLQARIEELVGDLTYDAMPFKHEFVTAKEFLEDPYYCGHDPITNDGVASTMFPLLKDDFIELHKPDSSYREVIISGAIGTGKSFFASLGVMRQLHFLSCLKNPQKYFNLASTAKISIVILSVTGKQAKKNIFFNVKEMTKKCPYFRENFMFDDKRATESLLFPNNVEVFNGTSAVSATIGLNVYACVLDEANFFKIVKKSARAKDASGDYDEALSLYYNLLRRQESRFLKKGRKPGLFYMCSSSVYPDDFTARRVKAAKEGSNKTTFIMHYNRWEVNRDEYSAEEFQVEIGQLNTRSRVLTGTETDVVGKVINVPTDFMNAFKKDVDNAIRDIAGIALYSVQPFFTQKEKIHEMFDESQIQIFSKQKVTLSPKLEYLAQEYILKHKIPHPEKTRYISMDIALKHDKLGFCLTGDSLITMNGGSVKQLKDVEVGDEVIDMFGKSQRVLNKFNNGKKHVVEIKIGGRTIKATKDHKFLCLKREKIFKYDRVIMPSTKKYGGRFQFEYEPEWIALKDIQQGDYLISPTYVFDENKNLDWSNDFCWLYGMYLAEGSVTKKENTVVWSLNSNETIFAREIVRIIRQEFNKHAYISFSNRSNCQIIRSRILKMFEPYVVNHSHNKKIKEEFFNLLSDEQMFWILTGMLDGDGSIGEYKQCAMKWTTVSKDLANQIILMLNKLGFCATHRTSWGELSRYRRNDVLLHGRDYQKWLGLKPNKQKSALNFKYGSQYYYKITEINDFGEADVFDIEVENSHSYLVSNFVAHNCMGFIEDMVYIEKEYFNDETQKIEIIKVKMPLVRIDLVLEVAPEEEFGEIELARVRNLIFQLRKFGYKIRYSSADGFQSADMQQILKRNGITHTYISTDKTTEPYETFRTAIYENRVKSIYHPKLELEMNTLEKNYVSDKINHSPSGCFVGDTQIEMQDGTFVRIDDHKHLVGKICKTFNIKNNETTCSKIIGHQLTKYVDELIEIELDNGTIIRCTTDHRFLLKNGQYKMAQDLTEDDDLQN